jgi:hypothetical protein
MALEDRDPKRAAAMLQTYIDMLDRFNREVRTTKGRRTRSSSSSGSTECKSDMAKAEQALADYQSTHKAAIITPAQSTATEAGSADLRAAHRAQVRLGIVRGYSREGSRRCSRSRPADQLDSQLRALPETGLELARLLREVQKYEQLYVMLTAQYEEARIDEARDVVTVDVLDAPVPPERKAHPHRLLLIARVFLLSLGPRRWRTRCSRRRSRPDPRPGSERGDREGTSWRTVRRPHPTRCPAFGDACVAARSRTSRARRPRRCCGWSSRRSRCRGSAPSVSRCGRCSSCSGATWRASTSACRTACRATWRLTARARRSARAAQRVSVARSP